MQKSCCRCVRACVWSHPWFPIKSARMHKKMLAALSRRTSPTRRYKRVRGIFPTKHPLCLFAVVMKNMQQVNSVTHSAPCFIWCVRSAKYLWLSATGMDVLAKCSFLFSISLSAATYRGMFSQSYLYRVFLDHNYFLLFLHMLIFFFVIFTAAWFLNKHNIYKILLVDFKLKFVSLYL